MCPPQHSLPPSHDASWVSFFREHRRLSSKYTFFVSVEVSDFWSRAMATGFVLGISSKLGMVSERKEAAPDTVDMVLAAESDCSVRQGTQA